MRQARRVAQFKEGEIDVSAHAVAQPDLYKRVIYCCVIGSQAYGLADAEADVDRRGIYLPTADLHWSLYGVPEQLENHETQEAYWELQKFLVLALKANPNVLECLYTRRWSKRRARWPTNFFPCGRVSSRGWSIRRSTVT